jgi:site-specific DNA-methyltransferase (adenine-specific)
MAVVDGSTGSQQLDPSSPIPEITPHLPSIKRRESCNVASGGTIDTTAGGLFNGDALELLSRVPDNSVDLAFADPPYNLAKRYSTYKDSIDIERYFDWCDQWLEEYVRITKPGGSIIILNMPLWSVRHFWYLSQRAEFRNWIAWEGLSLPVRFIMPAHYTLLHFAKDGPTRYELPLSSSDAVSLDLPFEDLLRPYGYGLCTRRQCLSFRQQAGGDRRRKITDLWTDIARLKHNTRRLDHPCILPPKLMMRIISLLTKPGDIVLDCFNGVGTTTLSAQALGRRYIGFELSQEYHEVSVGRHKVVQDGGDPFAKRKATPTTKNNSVPRVILKDYEIPKRTLQLEIRRIANELGRIPSRAEVESMAKYDIGLYDQYFRTWSEAVAAARVSGVTEYKEGTAVPVSMSLF